MDVTSKYIDESEELEAPPAPEEPPAPTGMPAWSWEADYGF